MRPSPRDDILGAEVSAALGVAIRVCRVTREAAARALTNGEQRQCRALASEARRHDWLLGRRALKALLPVAVDTSGLSFPHRRLSLSHAGDMAVAVAVDGPARPDGVDGVDRGWRSEVVGVGVDYEPWRDSDPRMAHFFLRPQEQSTALGLLRAWTVKEACYKAVPANHRCSLLDVGLDDPGAPTGTAAGPEGRLLRYTVIDTAAGPLAVAVCREDRRVAV